MTELRGVPSLPALQLDQRLENLRDVDRVAWNKAQQREAIIHDALKADGSMTTRVESAAKSLGLSARTVRRLISRYTASAQTTSLIDHMRGPNKSHRRLGPEIERIIDTAIQTHYLVRPRKPMESAYKEVKRRCHAEKRVTPSRNTVLKRIRALDARLVARKRLGAKSAESIALSTPGMLEANEALELIQIDHTLADVMIVDSVYRRSIGRPWLSLAIDVATRSVLGFHLGLEAPSALAVALCIEHAVLPKIASAAAPVTEASWDMFGVPKTILVDNGSEFHGEALTRGCAEYGIALTYRPVARPRFGAHIERLIGTTEIKGTPHKESGMEIYPLCVPIDLEFARAARSRPDSSRSTTDARRTRDRDLEAKLSASGYDSAMQLGPVPWRNARRGRRPFR